MRIVSLLPSATELLSVLGLERELVAVSHECDTPASVVGLPHATSSRIPAGLSQRQINELVADAVRAAEPLYKVDAGLIRSLEPDLVVTQGICDVCAVTPETIEASLRGTACRLPAGTEICSLAGTSIEGIFSDLRRLGALTGTPGRAEDAITQARSRLEALRCASTSGGDLRRKLMMLEWIDPAYSPGHWVPEQIEHAGFRSAIGSPGDHSRALSWSEVRAAEPDAIGVICCGYGLTDNLGFARDVGQVAELASWFDGPIVAFDANRYFSRPTLAVVEGAALLAEAFRGGAGDGEGFAQLRR